MSLECRIHFQTTHRTPVNTKTVTEQGIPWFCSEGFVELYGAGQLLNLRDHGTPVHMIVHNKDVFADTCGNKLKTFPIADIISFIETHWSGELLVQENKQCHTSLFVCLAVLKAVQANNPHGSWCCLEFH